MPQFQTLDASLATRTLLTAGKPAYVWGSYQSDQSPTRAYVTHVAGDGTHATLTLAIYEGNAPVEGQEITVRGCSVAGLDTENTVISAVTGFDTGDNSTGTVSYLNSTSQAGAAGSGMATIPTSEVAEALANGASMQVTVPYNDPRIDQSRSVTAQVYFPTPPMTATVVLQQSDDDYNYFDCIDPDTGTTVIVAVYPGSPPVTGGFAQIPNSATRFYRLNASGVTGSGTVVGKISA